MLSFLLNSLLLSVLLVMTLPALGVGQATIVLDDIAANAASVGALADNSSTDSATQAARQLLGQQIAQVSASQLGADTQCTLGVQIAKTIQVGSISNNFNLLGEGWAVCENPTAFVN